MGTGWAGKFQEIQVFCRISTETLAPGNSGKFLLNLQRFNSIPLGATCPFSPLSPFFLLGLVLLWFLSLSCLLRRGLRPRQAYAACLHA